MKHIKLFENDSDYEYFLQLGDTTPRPNVLLSKESKKLGFRGKAPKRIAKFVVNGNMSIEYGNRCVFGQKYNRLVHDTSAIESIKINGQDIEFSQPVYDDVFTSSNELMQLVQFQGDMFSAQDGGYMMNIPTFINFEPSPDDVWVFDTLLEELASSTAIMVCIGQVSDNGYRIQDGIPMLLSDMVGNFFDVVNDNRLMISDLVKSELEAGIAQGVTYIFLPFNYIDGTIPSYQYGSIQLVSGTPYIDVDGVGEYEVEFKFNTNELPMTIFGMGNRYVSSPLTELSQDFFDGIKNIPYCNYTYQYSDTFIIPDHIEGMLTQSMIPNGVHHLVVGKGITSIDDYALSSIISAEFKSHTAPQIFNVPWGTTTYSSNSARSVEISYPWGCDESYSDLVNACLKRVGAIGFSKREYEQLDKNLYDYDIVCVYNVSSATDNVQIINTYTNIESCIIDGGINQPLQYNKHQFSTSGLHVIKYKLKDNTTLSGVSFYNTLNLLGIIMSDTITSCSNELCSCCRGLQYVQLSKSLTAISASMFHVCGTLKTIELPESIESIGSGAFNSCTSLNQINIPSNVRSIGNTAFMSCKNLRHVEMHDGIQSLGNGVFSGCVKLTRVQLPKNLLEIPDTAFNQCTSLVEFVIPSTVQKIGNQAFRLCPLEQISIPSSVVEIQASAFAYCGLLKHVELVEGLQKIGDKAFFTCENLTNLVIPNSVKELGHSVIGNCNATNVFIGDGVESLYYDTFREQDIITISPNNPYLDRRDGFKGIINTTDNRIICGFGDTAIPSTVEIIGEYAYYNSTIDSITIPSNVTRIKHSAFGSCYSLTSITIPDSVTYIGWEAFRSCTSLAEINGGVNVEEIGYDAFYNTQASNLATGDTKVINNWLIKSNASGSVVLDESITHIVPSNIYKIFSNYSGITDIVFPSKVKHIPMKVLSGATSLTSVTLGGDVKSIGASAFTDCKALTTIESFTSVEHVGALAFCNCVKLTPPTFGDSLTRIDDYAFEDCDQFINVVLPEGVTSIGSGAFAHSHRMESITIPNSVTDIGNNAFEKCYALTTVQLGSGITTISDSMFYLCSGLTSIDIPDSVVSISSNAFRDCDNLTTVELPIGLTCINSKTFYSCNSLTAITIQEHVTEIKSNAFLGCPSLSVITCKSSISPSLDTFAFGGIVQERGTLYYPKGSDYSTWIDELPNGWVGQEVDFTQTYSE